MSKAVYYGVDRVVSKVWVLTLTGAYTTVDEAQRAAERAVAGAPELRALLQATPVFVMKDDDECW